MRFAYWINKATDTTRLYNTGFSLQQWFRERAWILRLYLYLACLVAKTSSRFSAENMRHEERLRVYVRKKRTEVMAVSAYSRFGLWHFLRSEWRLPADNLWRRVAGVEYSSTHSTTALDGGEWSTSHPSHCTVAQTNPASSVWPFLHCCFCLQ